MDLVYDPFTPRLMPLTTYGLDLGRRGIPYRDWGPLRGEGMVSGDIVPYNPIMIFDHKK